MRKILARMKELSRLEALLLGVVSGMIGALLWAVFFGVPTKSGAVLGEQSVSAVSPSAKKAGKSTSALSKKKTGAVKPKQGRRR